MIITHPRPQYTKRITIMVSVMSVMMMVVFGKYFVILLISAYGIIIPAWIVFRKQYIYDEMIRVRNLPIVEWDDVKFITGRHQYIGCEFHRVPTVDTTKKAFGIATRCLSGTSYEQFSYDYHVEFDSEEDRVLFYLTI